MKMALCFSGYLRDFERTFSSWDDNFLRLYDVDVFFDIWDMVNFDGNVRSADKIAALYDLYRPRAIRMERKISDFGKNIRPAHTRQATRGDINNPISMFYKIAQCNRLCKTVGVKYDLVFRARTDLMLHFPFEISSSAKDFINVSEHPFHMDYDKIGDGPQTGGLLKKYIDFQADRLGEDGLIEKQGIMDHLAFSSPEKMDIYCQVYDSYESYFDSGCNVRPEITLGYHLLVNGLRTRGFRNNLSVICQ